MEPRKSSPSLTTLQSEKSRLNQIIRELKAELSKLQRKNAKLEVENASARHRVKALEKLKVLPETKPLSDIEVARRIAFLLNKGGFEFVDGKAVQVSPPRGKP
jgi:hypothetical protein